ncbi:MAG: MerR family DNA-binding protein [Thermoanaerobaculia bacterium]
METLKIGQLAQRGGVGVETVRFYERRGLLDEPPRRDSGYRQYPVDAVPRLRFIRRAKELGFSLSEIKELLDLRVDERSSAADVRARAAAKIDEIAIKIADLQRITRALTELTDCCSGRGPIGECPILDAMEMNQEASKGQASTTGRSLQ